MEIDKTTLSDLSIFNAEEAFSVFNKLNFTVTAMARTSLQESCDPVKQYRGDTGRTTDIADDHYPRTAMANAGQQWNHQSG